MYAEREDRRAGYPTGLVALFIDWDNFAIGLREEMPGQPPDPGPMLRWARRFGTLVVCRAYGEWRDAAERLAVYNAGVETVYAPVLPLTLTGTRTNGGGKSLADTAMAVDCVDVVHLVPGLSTVIVASSDKDLIPILRFAQRRGLRVYVLGSDRTAAALRDMAHEYVTYRALIDLDTQAAAAPPIALPRPRRPGDRAAVHAARPLTRASSARRAPLAGSGVALSPVPAESALAGEARLIPMPSVPSPEPSAAMADLAAASSRRRRRGGRRRRPAAEGAGVEAVQEQDDALAPSVLEAHAALEGDAAEAAGAQAIVARALRPAARAEPVAEAPAAAAPIVLPGERLSRLRRAPARAELTAARQAEMKEEISVPVEAAPGAPEEPAAAPVRPAGPRRGRRGGAAAPEPAPPASEATASMPKAAADPAAQQPKEGLTAARTAARGGRRARGSRSRPARGAVGDGGTGSVQDAAGEAEPAVAVAAAEVTSEAPAPVDATGSRPRARARRRGQSGRGRSK